jgi:hypothetical protein
MTGFVFAAVQPGLSLRKDPGDMLCYAVLVPTNIISSLILVIMISTVNRHIVEELVNKLTLIDDTLCRLRGGCGNQRSKRRIQMFIPILIFTVSFMCYDSFLWSKNVNIIFCLMKRFSHIITSVAMM